MVSTKERTQIFLDRIDSHNKDINAILHVNPNAVKEAQEVDKKIAKGMAGKLAGLCIVVKSNILVEGMIINCASRTLENFKGTYDADVIKRIKEEDGVILGMANMDEFAAGATGETSAFGVAKNPSAPDRIPGGSSSGSAAAVAAGFCDIALGSETGGSIRNPASHCGVAGLKPSYGLVSRHGLIDLSMSLDAIGPIAKKSSDLAKIMDVISGKSENDARTIDSNVDFSLKREKLKVGILPKAREMCSDKRIYDLISEKLGSASKELGFEIVEVDLPYIELAVQTYYPLVYVEFFSGTRKFDGKKYGKKIEDSCGEEVLRRILGGKEISRAEYEGRHYRLALKAKELIKKGIEKAFENVDLIILPVTPKLPHKLGTKISDPKEIYAYDAFTIPANLAGICAGSVPAGKIDNIPVGMQVIGRGFDDSRVLSFMDAFEGVQR